ncbi:hypothetical protein M404DRAFT_35391 [Pisolithus tinctorius Marx 270]|uniref:Helitron helicase-like domain-containing protein n=1 Tax=Pisolithus tinctorius Marx 270 TaxID=870435 RepID=A0A0C3NE82_PISTI|nr:hypothetical protein M404DRAFT_35391 [Pisolithus tinctorius Marx 270]
MTINPADTHNPIAQVLAGEIIDLDRFDALAGPDSHQHATNIASNPYAAAKFFNFLIETMLETLLGITKRPSQACSDMGILRQLSGYFGVVEAQGRGTLHMHMLLWLAGTPDTAEMQCLLQTPTFHEKIWEYIRVNIHAHLDDVTEQDLKTMAQNTQLAYSRPPDPEQDDWDKCTHLLDEDVYVNERGNWKPKRTLGYINNYCPLILTNLRCNNDIKINTNGEDTKDVTFYVTTYATKKQKKSHNLSVLMASALAYHENDPWYEDIREQNQLLLYRCINVINREVELSGPQVVSYIMGYGDTFQSHCYAPLYTSVLFTAIRQMFPGLSTTTHRNAIGSVDDGGNEHGGENIQHSEGCTERDDESKMVTLHANKSSNVYTCSQLEDYVFRGPEMDKCGLLAFRDQKLNEATLFMCGRNTWTDILELTPIDMFFKLRVTTPYLKLQVHGFRKLTQAQDLKGDAATWDQEFHTFMAQMHPSHRRILSGIQFYYESRSACDTTSTEASTSASHNDRVLTDKPPLDDDGDDPMEESHILLTYADLIEFKCNQLS